MTAREYTIYRAGEFHTARGWSDSEDARLRALWDEGLSTAVIGVRLGRQKNSIIGRAHRLKLPRRPSPICRAGRPDSYPDKPRVARVPIVARTPTLPALASEIIVARKPPPPPAPKVPEPRPPQRKRDCCWPIGEPGAKSFRFCCEPAALGYPYCEAHCRQAYQNWRRTHPFAVEVAT